MFLVGIVQWAFVQDWNWVNAEGFWVIIVWMFSGYHFPTWCFVYFQTDFPPLGYFIPGCNTE